MIIGVDGHAVAYVAQLQEAIAFQKPGAVVSLDVARKGGTRVTLRVPLENGGGVQVAAADHNGGQDESSGDRATAPLLGVTVVPTDASAVSQLQLPDDVRGVIVTSIDDNSPVAGRLAAPDQGGPDVILSVEGTPVPTPEALRDALHKASHGVVEGGAPIVTLQVYNVPSKTRRIERVRLATTTGT